MTPQEALKVIDKVHDYPRPYGIGGTAWMYIRSYIEKQIPKKPLQACGHRTDRTMNYCPMCGQALDWSDTE